MKKNILTLATTITVFSASVCAREGMHRTHMYGQMGEGHRYSVDLPEIYRLYGHLEWEIIAGFRHKDGHMGTYTPGDTISMTISVGPIGGRTYARSKHFGRGNSPKPVIEILEDGKPDGKVIEKFRFQAGAC